MSQRKWTRRRIPVVLGTLAAALALAGAADAQAEVTFTPAISLEVEHAHVRDIDVAHLTAVANNIDIASSPYIITIRDETAGVSFWCNNNANVCPQSIAMGSASTHTYRAHIQTPGGVIIANSNAVMVTWSSTIVLQASSNSLDEGQMITLAAKSKFAGPIVIKDTLTGAIVGECLPANPCPLTNVASTHDYVATQTVVTGRNRQMLTSNVERVQWMKLLG